MMHGIKDFEDFALDREDWRLVAYFDESILSLECKAHFAEKDAFIFKAFWKNSLDKAPKKIRKNPNYEDDYYLQNNEYADYEHDFYSIRGSKLA